jgi:uncharacterized protein (DUF362 family)
MESFVKLKTLFNEPDERDIKFLANQYLDSSFLSDAIRELIKNELNAETVFNKTVLVKPNWVNHDRNQDDEICLRTNDNFLLALVKVLLMFKPFRIIIGDAPIQGADWEKICSLKFINEINKNSEYSKIPISIIDFRNTYFIKDDKRINSCFNYSDGHLIIDVGGRSFLDSIPKNEQEKFRVSHYNHNELRKTHKPGVHKYFIARELFEADIIISVPKVKTHQKTGITAALKNLVGFNGRKEYLPHHKIGGTENSGDSYPGNNLLRNLSSCILDISNRNVGGYAFRFWQKIGIETWKLSNPGKYDQLGAGWFGNDTTWRMVLDINLIAIYGCQNGVLSNSPQRQIFSICDGIIGGQGDGPLFPRPFPLGVISFSNNAALNDYIIAFLMGFNPNKIKLIENAFNLYEYKLSNLILNGEPTNIEELSYYIERCLPPPGWEGYL